MDFTKFTSEDIETLIQAVGDWEAVGSMEYNVFNALRHLPELEGQDLLNEMKHAYASREKDILANRDSHHEKSVFLKTKLMMLRKNAAIDSLFNGDAGFDLPLSRKTLAEEYIQQIGAWNGYAKFIEEKTST